MNEEPIFPNEQERFKFIAHALSDLLNNVSHDINGQIGTLRIKQKMLQQIIPTLLNGYKVAIDHQLIEQGISQRVMNGLTDLSNIEEQLEQIILISEIAHQYAQRIDDSKNNYIPSIHTFINDLMSKYQETSLIGVSFQNNIKEDFAITINSEVLKELLIQSISILVGNPSTETQIEVQTIKTDKGGTLQIKAPTSSEQIVRLQTMFGRHFPTLSDEKRVGLGFCRLALYLAQGTIDVTSDNFFCYIIVHFSK